MSDTNLLNSQIVEFMNHRNHFFWRQNVIGVRNRKAPEGSAGQGDVVGMLYPVGRHCELETKKQKERYLPSQIEHRQKVIAAGGIYQRIESMEELIQWYNSLVLPPKR